MKNIHAQFANPSSSIRQPAPTPGVRIIHTLVQRQHREPVPRLDVLVDIPRAAGLQQPVQQGDVLLRLRDAAQAANADNAVDGAGLNLAVPRGRVIDALDADRHDLVYVLQTDLLYSFTQRRGRRGIRFDAVDFRNLAMGVADARQHVRPHAAAGADLDNDAAHGRVDLVLAHFTGGHAALEQRDDLGLATFFCHWSHVHP